MPAAGRSDGAAGGLEPPDARAGRATRAWAAPGARAACRTRSTSACSRRARRSSPCRPTSPSTRSGRRARGLLSGRHGRARDRRCAGARRLHARLPARSSAWAGTRCCAPPPILRPASSAWPSSPSPSSTDRRPSRCPTSSLEADQPTGTELATYPVLVSDAVDTDLMLECVPPPPNFFLLDEVTPVTCVVDRSHESERDGPVHGEGGRHEAADAVPAVRYLGRNQLGCGRGRHVRHLRQRHRRWADHAPAAITRRDRSSRSARRW